MLLRNLLFISLLSSLPCTSFANDSYRIMFGNTEATTSAGGDNVVYSAQATPRKSDLRTRREEELSNRYNGVDLPCGWQPKDALLARSYRRLLKESGINKIALHNTFRFYEQNKTKKSLRQDYLTIVDFDKHSSTKRLKIIKLSDGVVSSSHLTSHGKGNSRRKDGYVDKLSTRNGSNATPPGFHALTGHVFNFKGGKTYRVKGMESRNSNSQSRGMLYHARNYARYQGRNKPIGRSWGCYASSPQEVKVIFPKLRPAWGRRGLIYNYFKTEGYRINGRKYSSEASCRAATR